MNMDEDILKIKNAVKQAEKEAHGDEAVQRELKQSIYGEQIDIFGAPMVFKDTMLLDGKISIRIPEDFIEMEEDVVKALYPMGNKPNFVMSNDPFYFMLGFNHTNHHIPEEQLKEFPALAKGMLTRGGPQVNVTKMETVSQGGRQIAKLSFINQALIGGAMCNKMFYSNVSGRLLIGFINFKYQHRKRIDPLAEEIIGSYRILEEYVSKEEKTT